jgi:hypothetical protein
MLLAIPLFTISGMAIKFSLAITNSMLTSTVYAVYAQEPSFLMKWGNLGRGIGSFSQPLEIAIDSTIKYIKIYDSLSRSEY